MSEKASGNGQSNASIENFKAKQEAELAKARSEEALLEQIFGDSLAGDSLEDEKRVQEGTEYYSRLEDMSNREDDFTYTPEHVDGLKEDELGDVIESIPRLRSLNSLAHKITILNEQIISSDDQDRSSLMIRLDELESRFATLYDRYNDEGLSAPIGKSGEDRADFLNNFNNYNEKGLVDKALESILDKAFPAEIISDDIDNGFLENLVEDELVTLESSGEPAEQIELNGRSLYELKQEANNLAELREVTGGIGSSSDYENLKYREKCFKSLFEDYKNKHQKDSSDNHTLDYIWNIAYGSEKAESSPKEESSPVVEATEASELSTEDIQKRIDSLMKFATDINALKNNEKSYSDNRKILEGHIKSILDYCLEEYNSKTISLDRYNEFVKSTHQLRLAAEGEADIVDSSQGVSNEADSTDETEKDNRSTRPIELDQTIFDDFIIPDSLEHSQGENGESVNSTIENNVGLKDLSDIVDGYEKRKFLDRSEYDRAINTYHDKRSEILSKLDKLSRINPNVAAEKDEIIAALDGIDSRFAEIDPELPETKNLMEKITSGISQKFSKLVERVNQRNETNIPKELPKPPRMPGESSGEYYKRLKKSNISTFMALVAVSRS